MVVVYILVALLLVLAILYFLAPKHYDVSRKIVIDKPVNEVYTYLKYLKNQDDWSPWQKKDPDMKREFIGTDGSPGFISKWEGNKQVGSGEQELKRLVENERIESELRFLKPWKSTSDAYITVLPVDMRKTEVKWGFNGENKFPFRFFALFMDMDKMVGKDFEEGLYNLKIKLEQNTTAQ